MAIHTVGGLGEIEVVQGVYFAAKKQNLDELVRTDERFKVFVGHPAGGPDSWKARLSRELRAIPVKLEDVFDVADDLWSDLCKGRWPESFRKCSESSIFRSTRR